MSRFFDWAVGTFAFYAIGMAAASFIAGDFILPLSTATDRLWLVLCGFAAIGMMFGEDSRK